MKMQSSFITQEVILMKLYKSPKMDLLQNNLAAKLQVHHSY